MISSANHVNYKKQGLLNLHAANLLFGGTALFSKLIPLPALDITALRCVVAIAVLLIVLVARKKNIRIISLKHGVLMLVSGLLMGVHWITYFHSMQVSSVAVGMIALFTHPIITIFLEPLFKQGKPHITDIICGVAVLFGIYLMIPSFSLESSITLGVLWGMLSALCFSIRNVVQGHYLSEYGGDVSILYQGTVVVLLTLPFLNHIPSFSDHDIWIKLLVLGVFFTALPHALFASSLRFLRAKTASLIACLQPVYGTFLAFLVLSEEPTWATLLGGCIIVSASSWESYKA